MPNLDPSAVGASMGSGDPLSTSYVSRLANQQSATPSAPSLYGGQAQPTSSFGADLQSAASGHTQGADATVNDPTVGASYGANTGYTAGATASVASRYGEQGAQNALSEQEDRTHALFSQVYEQTWEEENQ